MLEHFCIEKSIVFPVFFGVTFFEGCFVLDRYATNLLISALSGAFHDFKQTVSGAGGWNPL
jgi:hypothetical protein